MNRHRSFRGLYDTMPSSRTSRRVSSTTPAAAALATTSLSGGVMRQPLTNQQRFKHVNDNYVQGSPRQQRIRDAASQHASFTGLDAFGRACSKSHDRRDRASADADDGLVIAGWCAVAGYDRTLLTWRQTSRRQLHGDTESSNAESTGDHEASEQDRCAAIVSSAGIRTAES